METTHTNAPEKNKLMAVLSYLGPLVIVAYIFGKDDQFVKFHIKQGLVLLIIEVILSLLGGMMWTWYAIIQLLNIGIFILATIGILNALKAEEKKLPLVGDFARYFTF